MRWLARIVDCFSEVCLEVRPRAQVAMVAEMFRPPLPLELGGALPNFAKAVGDPRTSVDISYIRGAGADGFDNTDGGGGCLPTSSGPRFITWGARYSEQPSMACNGNGGA
ncbi:hypothetical protein HPB50_018313 [Hyalomma asiaticum]|uniref:Uncharacterized protein n=1 Tax=Hyalomma asiaticum TaxID=266040 RepID=A0ACB7RP84_HYAAI|nr:hypothetical protein HPB50_018313 [Hyalomma asiaticum]